MEAHREIALPPVAARYFPPAGGKYEVKPGLIPLGTNFGNGVADARVFQFDAGFAEYRKVKQAARAERLGKYYQTRDFAPAVAGVVCRFIARRLAEEHPELFAAEDHGGALTLRCALSGETLSFDPKMQGVECGDAHPPYADPFDALAAQVQEDLAVVRRAAGKDWASAIHLCYPYRWTVEEKIGLDFVTMHLPVPGMETFRKPGMVTNMVQYGPFVRFVWELCTDTRLNHHREPPPGIAPGGLARTPLRPAESRALPARRARGLVGVSRTGGCPPGGAHLVPRRGGDPEGCGSSRAALRHDRVNECRGVAVQGVGGEPGRHPGVAARRGERLGAERLPSAFSTSLQQPEKRFQAFSRSNSFISNQNPDPPTASISAWTMATCPSSISRKRAKSRCPSPESSVTIP